jgi:hypothetical protein
MLDHWVARSPLNSLNPHSPTLKLSRFKPNRTHLSQRAENDRSHRSFPKGSSLKQKRHPLFFQ